MGSDKPLMRGLVVLVTIAAAALAQDSPVVSASSTRATVPSGVPLRVALEGRVRIKHVGDRVRGRLAEPVYVFDRLVLPAGSVVEGHVAEIGGVAARVRIGALLNGNLTPPRKASAQFDALVLRDGSRLSLRTSPARGTAQTVAVANRPKGPAARQSGASAGPGKNGWAAIYAFQAPGRMSQLKSALLSRLPYHRQAWRAGTLFSGVLQEPIAVPALDGFETGADRPGLAEPEARELRARLLTAVSSATARKGMAVEAVVTRPLFSVEHRLLIPEGSRLTGEVAEAQPARRLHRNGRLRIAFRQIEPRPGAAQSIQGFVTEVDADFNAHLALDSEGATRATSPKTRLIFPAISVAVAGLSFHQDFNSRGVPDVDSGGRAESGAVGMGLIGAVVAQASRPLASTIAIAGAAFSVYSNFIARGNDVVFPVNTPIEVSLAARPDGGQPPTVRPR
jgi:hypothetical protein